MTPRVTPRAKAAYKAAEWRRALAEGRVVRYNNGLQFTSHPTKQGAEDHLALLILAYDDSAAIVQAENAKVGA